MQAQAQSAQRRQQHRLGGRASHMPSPPHGRAQRSRPQPKARRPRASKPRRAKRAQPRPHAPRPPARNFFRAHARVLLTRARSSAGAEAQNFFRQGVKKSLPWGPGRKYRAGLKIGENAKRGLGERRRAYKGQKRDWPGRDIAGAGKAQRARERPWRRSAAETGRRPGAGEPEEK